MMLKKILLPILILVSLSQTISAQTGEKQTIDYARDIQPILAENCFACHGVDPETRAQDLRLDIRDAAIDGGAIEPNDPDASSMVDRVYSDDPSTIMPPPESHRKLTAEQKDLLKRWIEEGAEYTTHWSLVAPVKTAAPKTKNEKWVRNAIDRFVLAGLEKTQLQPAAEADARTIFRRLSLDITGLPPATKDLDAFVREYEADSESAMSSWIDKLMDRPSWGEHRARYWLDAARYADTHGMHFDNYREIWPYRDWVIRAFNKNQPFDQFTVEQLAGDLLDSPTTDQLIATGFQRCNMTTNEGGTIDEENRAIYASDRVQTFGWVYLGLTTNCCQCHDHKFDPITMKDYYSLAAFFRNTTEKAKDGNVPDGRGPTIKVPTAEDEARLAQLQPAIAAAMKKTSDYRDSAKDAFDQWQANARREPSPLSTKGLVLNLPLNEGEGEEVESLGATPATFKLPEKIQWKKDGRIGPSLVIQNKKTIEIGDAGDFEFDQEFSYGAWVRSPKNSSGSAMLARMDTGNSFRGWDLYQQDRQYTVHLIDKWPGSALKVRTKRKRVLKDKWQHVFVTYDGSRKIEGIKIYVDGKLEETIHDKNNLADNASLRTKVPTRVGGRHADSLYNNGSVQDVRIYDRTLSEAEVKTLAEQATLGILAVDAAERTEAQRSQLMDFYLENEDPKYGKLAAAAAKLLRQKKAIDKRTPITLVQVEKKGPAKTHLLMRGAYDKKGDEVTAAPPAVLHPLPENAPANRLGLAKWVVDDANPLTSRVTVNRFWQQIFGQGIVASTEDFGIMGTPPSNQALLDWLAVDFRESGWDVKRCFKQILMSSTYRQLAITTPQKLLRDRDNSLLSRGPRFRMDAEMIRDYALSASGLISRKMYGPGTKSYQPDNLWNVVGLPGGDTREYKQDTGENLYRRSLYAFWKRMSPPPNLEIFNAPSREVCTVRRERTNTPLQALVTLNDPQYVEAARVLAENALVASEGMTDAAIEHIALKTVCRRFNEAETKIVQESLQQYRNRYSKNIDAAKQLLAVGSHPQNSQLEASELAAWTMLCNQILNLDEVLNK